MANNDNETYHEIPASKYYYLSDSIGAVPKWLFKFWTPLMLLLGGAITFVALETNLWQRLFSAIFLGGYWYVGWGASGILALIILFNRKSNKKLGVKK